MKKRLDDRKKRLENVEKQTYGTHCTFQPALKSKSPRPEIDELEFDEDSKVDPAKAFLKRMTEDLNDRKVTKPDYFAEKKRPSSAKPFIAHKGSGQAKKR